MKGHPTSDGWAPPLSHQLPDFRRSNVDDNGNVVEDERGDPVVKHPTSGEDVRYWAPSAYGNVLSNQFNLWQWKTRMAMIGVASQRKLQAEVAAAANDKKALNKLIQQAISAAGGDDAARIGTALHTLVEQVNRGGKPTTFEGFEDDVAAYRTCLADHGFEVVRGWVEVRVVNDEFRRAGSFDVVLRRRNDGVLFIADVKTSEKARYPKVEYLCQQWIYTNGVAYDTTNDTRHPLPTGTSTDEALLVVLPAGTGTCELHTLDLHIGRQAVDEARVVRSWHYRKDFLRPYRPPLVPVPTPAAWQAPPEGRPLSERRMAELREMYSDLGLNDAFVDHLLAESRVAGRCWAVRGTDGKATERRYWIAKAAMAWADADEDQLRLAIGLAMQLGEDVQGTTGAALGSLTIDEAKRLYESRFDLIFHPDGSVEVRDTPLPAA